MVKERGTENGSSSSCWFPAGCDLLAALMHVWIIVIIKKENCRPFGRHFSQHFKFSTKSPLSINVFIQHVLTPPNNGHALSFTHLSLAALFRHCILKLTIWEQPFVMSWVNASQRLYFPSSRPSRPPVPNTTSAGSQQCLCSCEICSFFCFL